MRIIMANETKNNISSNSEVKEEKRHNPTWEAFGMYKGAFTYVAPEMYD